MATLQPRLTLIFQAITLALTMHSAYANARELAHACDESTLAGQWIRSIESQDWSRMSELLASEASYTDPTMSYFGVDPVNLNGRQSIVEFWKKSSDESDSQEIRYDVVRCFETGGVTVLTLELSISVSGAYWNVAKERIDLTGHQTTVVKVNEKTIASVIDYVDYADAERQIDDYRRKHGPVRDSNKE